MSYEKAKAEGKLLDVLSADVEELKAQVAALMAKVGLPEQPKRPLFGKKVEPAVAAPVKASK